MKIGLFFGSFNPIHTGHLIIANLMAETTDLNKVWFVVTPQNPLKPAKSLLHDFDRYDMVRAAVYDNYKLEVSDVEFHLPQPNYTIHTLVHLSEKHPDKEFKVIIGEDNLNTFTKWKNYQQILNNYGLYVYPRMLREPPTPEAQSIRQHPHVKMVTAPLIGISATFIRTCVKNNHSIRYLVPDAVEAIIRSKKFYL